MKHYKVLSQYFFMQKIMGFNRSVPWPVDFRSKIRGWQFIEKGIMCDPGDNTGLYINAYGGLKMGDNVGISSNTVIVTTNHNKYDHRKPGFKKGVVIGNNVWIGANCVILPGTIIGNEVTIGAGCVISGQIPSKSTVVRDSNHIQIIPKEKDYEWDIYQEKLT
jgi:acetyltransferase-like isoleucine patch superfamily enzyme